MSTLVQISDPHFGTEQPAVVAALFALVSHVKPVAAVLSGDITQRARRAQFAAAKRFVDQLGVPHWLAIPGNHDIPLFNVVARALAPYGGYQRAFGTLLEPRLTCAGFQLIGVNTTRPSRHKDGEISKEQVERVASELRQAPADRLRIVVTHQPVHVLRSKDAHNRVHGYHEAVMQWAAAGADIIMGGHIHLPYVAALRDHFPALPRRCWIVQAGTAVSHRIRAKYPNSVNLVHYTAGSHQCRVERWDYEAASTSFRSVESNELDLDRTESCSPSLRSA
ncbi:MAG TPA: metallophosphoesterase [Steroidobacteraceae bacterium]|nr:metallophosphoesterase [Steroidobacteraceae bacterium]